MTAAGFDGVRRIFAYVRVPWTNARLAVGLDESVVHSGIDREIGIAYVQLALFGMLVLLAGVVRRRAADRAADPIAGAHGDALRARRSAGARNGGALDRRIRAAGGRASTTWRASSPPAKRNCRSPISISRNWRASTASPVSPTGAASTASSSASGSERTNVRQPLALMMIDIDHFKLFNDRYGHVQGDACLRAVGETLSLVTLEEAVLVARYGGEEFALLLPGLDIERGDRACRRGAQSDRRPSYSTRGNAVRPRHHQHRRRVARAGAGSTGRRPGRGRGRRALCRQTPRPQHGGRASFDCG